MVGLEPALLAQRPRSTRATSDGEHCCAAMKGRPCWICIASDDIPLPVRLAGGYPYPRSARNRDHALSSRNAATSKLADTPPAARMVTPRSLMTSKSDAPWSISGESA
jgi:hypothetical protein